MPGFGVAAEALCEELVGGPRGAKDREGGEPEAKGLVLEPDAGDAEVGGEVGEGVEGGLLVAWQALVELKRELAGRFDQRAGRLGVGVIDDLCHGGDVSTGAGWCAR